MPRFRSAVLDQDAGDAPQIDYGFIRDTIRTALYEMFNGRTAWPRLLSRDQAATYLSVSPKEIERLINVGAISVVRLPASRHKNNVAVDKPNRRVLIDREELDALCTQNRERHR